MTDKPSIPFAETVGLLLKNAGVSSDEQLTRSLAMAIAIKFQETQTERDDAIYERGFRDELEKATKWHDGMAELAMNSLSCGSENGEYKAARRAADFHRAAAKDLRALAPADDGTVRVPREKLLAVIEANEEFKRDVPGVTDKTTEAIDELRAMIAQGEK